MTSSSFWKFRPSALKSTINNFTGAFSRETLTEYYDSDNQRATEEGVEILHRPEASKLRTLQWNINSGRHNLYFYKYSSGAIQKGLIDAIKDADADVVVLNEYSRRLITSGAREKLQTFEEQLKDMGYSYVDCATLDYGTALATKLKVKQHREIRLSEDRSALLAQVQTKDGTLAWIIGTHLNFVNGDLRLKEMQVLIKELTKLFILGDGDDDKRNCCCGVKGNCTPKIVLMGDLNQQRERDYSTEEWERIRSGMEARRSSQNDGVAQLLLDQGFVCSWDSKPPPAPPATNWETDHPPATHWSGTIVDYSYGRNISPLTVSIGPSGWSDHRMTVCDWAW